MAPVAEYPVAFVPGVGHWDYWCGVSESVYQITTHLECPPLVIANGPHGLARRLAREGRPVAVVDFVLDAQGFRKASVFRKVQWAAAWVQYVLRLYRLLRRHRVRVVYTANQASVLASIPAKLAGAKLVTGVRGSNGKMGKWRWVFRLSDRAAVLSREMGETLCHEFDKKPIPHFRAKLRVIYNGVNLAVVPDRCRGSEEIRSALGLGQRDVLVLYVAAFRSWKGQLRFIREVIPKCLGDCERAKGIRFAFLGSATEDHDREYEAACREAAGRSGFGEAIHFAGFRDNVWPWYAAANLVVLASEHEGMPRAIIEAMACGKPSVAYEVCSVGELLHDTGAGVVLAQGDVVGMAEAIGCLCGDSEARTEMGAKALAFARANLDIRSVARSYETMFGEMM
ncbi:MAG: glycosyltransferase family 4 protein [Pirellulales bacterium]